MSCTESQWDIGLAVLGSHFLKLIPKAEGRSSAGRCTDVLSVPNKAPPAQPEQMWFQVPGGTARLIHFQTLCIMLQLLTSALSLTLGQKVDFLPCFWSSFAISMAVSCKALQHVLFQMVHRKPILAVTKCSELTTTFLLLFGSGLIFFLWADCGFFYQTNLESSKSVWSSAAQSKLALLIDACF